MCIKIFENYRCDHYLPFVFNKYVDLSIVFVMVLIAVPFVGNAACQGTRKASSIVIHDSTPAKNGGEKATADLRNAFESALARENPCVETIDDQDIRDALQDERDRAMLEDVDSSETLAAIGQRMNANLIMSVSATPGPSGSTVYSAVVMDSSTARAVARGAGTSASEIAENLVSSLKPYLAQDCKPHWIGTVIYESTFSESKQTKDEGAMHAARRNTKRTLTQTSKMNTMIKAVLQPPADSSASVNSPKARVIHRVNFTFTKISSTSGEQYCRLPGRNPFYKSFSEDFSETVTQLGQGVETMPVFISVDSDGTYSIRVIAPGGVMLGKIETSSTRATCEAEEVPPTKDAVSMPDGKLQSTSFEATGKTNPKNLTQLAGSQKLPDGRTTITWSLRLVKPKDTK